MDIENAVRFAYQALQRGDAAAALAALPGPGGGGARAEAYRAQALRTLGRLDEADSAAAAAIALARQAGDVEGVAQLRELRASIVASLAAERVAAAERARDAGLATTPVATLLAGAADGPERARRLLRRAGALADAGNLAEATRTARIARDEAEDDPRESVLALLSMARTDRAGAERWIRDAHAVADASDDMNLVTAVAHAARAAGVVLAPPDWTSPDRTAP